MGYPKIRIIQLILVAVFSLSLIACETSSTTTTDRGTGGSSSGGSSSGGTSGGGTGGGTSGGGSSSGGSSGGGSGGSIPDLITPPPSQGTNAVFIHNRTLSAMSQRPVSVPKVFKQGEIQNYAKAQGTGVTGLTQCDVKNRWPDGSVKFAIVSFLADIPAEGSIEVDFTNQATGNNNNFLSKADMLTQNYDFDGTIETTGYPQAGATVMSARAMLQADHYRYWLQGPIVTAVILEDQNPSLPYDTSLGITPLHPIFEAWFYPANGSVELGYTLENSWASTDAQKSMRTVSYSLRLTEGQARRQVATHGTFTHDARVRWHQQHKVGPDSGNIHIQHDPSYLIASGAVPNFDTSLNISPDVVTARANAWNNSDKSYDVGSNGIGNYDTCDIDGGGSNHWIGPMPTWDILWVMTQDERMAKASLGNANLAGFFLFHLRERDQQAGTGNWFDADEGQSGTVETFGKLVSVNARKLINLSVISDENKCPQQAEDKINTLQRGNGGWCNRYEAPFDTSHMPDVAYVPYLISGRFYYLEELLMQAAFVVGHKTELYWDGNGYVCSPTGDDGYIVGDQIRGVGWAFRTLVYANFIAVDGSPERDYLNDKLLDNIAFWEGRNDLPLSDTSRQNHYNLGQTTWEPSPLGLIDSADDLAGPVIGSEASKVTSLWMENFLVFSWGIARDMLGAPTDNLLKYTARHRFNVLLNPTVQQPQLLESYRFATRLSNGSLLSTWDQVNTTHGGMSWLDENELSTDHSYGYINLSAMSYLVPYTVDNYSGAEAWNTLYGATGRASGKLWRRPQVLENNSPKWSILPRVAP